jgi:hypothetical protein
MDATIRRLALGKGPYEQRRIAMILQTKKDLIRRQDLVPRKSVKKLRGLYDAEASERRAALGLFLDDWEKQHGPITSVELNRAGKELRKKSQVLRKSSKTHSHWGQKTDMRFPGCRPRPLLKGFLHNPPEFHSSRSRREQKTGVGGDRSPTPPDCS